MSQWLMVEARDYVVLASDVIIVVQYLGERDF